MILITGGCGYVGSHAVARLLELNQDIVVLDNLSNSSKSVIKQINKISDKKFKFIHGDLNDRTLLISLFKDNKIDTVLHFAGVKSVSESIKFPTKYYLNNVAGTINLLKVMEQNHVFKLIFSSSATVYDPENQIPWKEEFSTDKLKHPYADSKIMIENILKSICNINKKWKIGILRYFNPIGAHSSGLIGEFNINKNTNLMPNINKTFLGYQNSLYVYGNDFQTKDGTGVRDYIHIEDLISGHLRARDFIQNKNGIFIWNLGAGKGYSVLEIIEKCSAIYGKKINYKIVDRRPGDLGEYWADIRKSEKELNWKPKRNLDRMITDTYKFIIKSKNNLF